MGRRYVPGTFTAAHAAKAHMRNGAPADEEDRLARLARYSEEERAAMVKRLDALAGRENRPWADWRQGEK